MFSASKSHTCNVIVAEPFGHSNFVIDSSFGFRHSDFLETRPISLDISTRLLENVRATYDHHDTNPYGMQEKT